MLPKIILDLCAGSGAWSQPYADAGYEVIRVDLPKDARLIRWDVQPIHGILAAPPCTCFSYARNRYPATEAQLKDALSIVDACLRAVVIYQPQWWALENPRAGLRRYLGPAQFEFKHHEFGAASVKPTCIWGKFNVPVKTPGPRLKPSTYKTATPNAHPRDAITPAGFARAFFKANP